MLSIARVLRLLCGCNSGSSSSGCKEVLWYAGLSDVTLWPAKLQRQLEESIGGG